MGKRDELRITRNEQEVHRCRRIAFRCPATCATVGSAPGSVDSLPVRIFLAGRIDIVPTPYPKEFRADVVAVARQGDKSRAQVARSFGISESCLARWLRIADRDDGASAPATEVSGSGLEAENRELRKRTKQLEQENEILRRATAYFARDTLPK